MFPFIKVKDSQINLAPEQVLLRKVDYQEYLAASELVEVAKKNAEEIELNAQLMYEKNKSLGRLAGVEQARVEQAILIQETFLQCQSYYRQVEHKMSEVVVRAVRKILRGYDNAELVMHVTREALSLVSNEKSVTLHVEPNQVNYVRERVFQILTDFPEVGHIHVIPDSRLDQGGCILETEIGIIDASIDGQLAALERALYQSGTKIE